MTQPADPAGVPGISGVGGIEADLVALVHVMRAEGTMVVRRGVALQSGSGVILPTAEIPIHSISALRKNIQRRGRQRPLSGSNTNSVHPQRTGFPTRLL